MMLADVGGNLFTASRTECTGLLPQMVLGLSIQYLLFKKVDLSFNKRLHSQQRRNQPADMPRLL
eukprot:scaffold20428_cov64-Cylindrotheca_fusiformis.AAC.2